MVGAHNWITIGFVDSSVRYPGRGRRANASALCMHPASLLPLRPAPPRLDLFWSESGREWVSFISSLGWSAARPALSARLGGGRVGQAGPQATSAFFEATGAVSVTLVGGGGISRVRSDRAPPRSKAVAVRTALVLVGRPSLCLSRSSPASA